MVVLSHLHFDHAGGLFLPYSEGVPLTLAFPRASYVVGKDAWERGCDPHPRDRASFIPELPTLLEGTGRLELVSGAASEILGKGYTMSYSNGHTPGLMLTRVEGPNGPITFMGDLVPGTPWVNLPITMGYDRYPELLIDEKEALLRSIHDEHGWLSHTHDSDTAASRIEIDDKGRFTATDLQRALHWGSPS